MFFYINLCEHIQIIWLIFSFFLSISSGFMVKSVGLDVTGVKNCRASVTYILHLAPRFCVYLPFSKI